MTTTTSERAGAGPERAAFATWVLRGSPPVSMHGRRAEFSKLGHATHPPPQKKQGPPRTGRPAHRGASAGGGTRALPARPRRRKPKAGPRMTTTTTERAGAAPERAAIATWGLRG